MGSVFFRRPTDGSSSSSSDDSPSEEGDLRGPPTEDKIDDEGPTATTESLPSQESVSQGDEVDTSATPIPNVEHHRTRLISALLEDFAKTRASAYLNDTYPGSKFDKSSPEVQPLAESVYQQVSQSLALTGILPTSSEGDHNKQERAAYIAGLESLALSNVQSHSLPRRQDRPQLPPSEQRLTVAKNSSQQQGFLSRAFQEPIAHLSLRQNPIHLSSPYPGLAVSASEIRLSHYESSFQQLRLLGKGGFGRVYHAYNVFDKKEYAVKKIPLSPRLSQRYRESGHKEIDNILREVQALAQLEHNNVVRYHATWIEEPRMVPDTNLTYQQRGQSFALQGRKLIAGRGTHALPGVIRSRSPVTDHNDGIVFGNDSRSATPIREIEESADGLTWSVNKTEPEPSSVRASEIFTDGNARPSLSEDSIADDTVYVLHVQMSVYPMTLAQYLATSLNSKSDLVASIHRHCFHLLPALRILLGILCGLQYIHARGLIHRDIKPSNIFVSDLDLSATGLIPDGFHDVGSCKRCRKSAPHFVNPRIGDFGLVAELARESDHNTPASAGKSTKVVGTEYYRPPHWTDPAGSDDYEIEVDEKVDVFALGVTLVELLWPCVTSTERMHVLQDVQRGKLPANLSAKINEEGYEHGTGDLVIKCISGMIEREPYRRWGCTQVKDHVESLLKRCETSSNNGVRHDETEGIDLNIMSRVKSIDEITQQSTSLHT